VDVGHREYAGKTSSNFPIPRGRGIAGATLTDGTSTPRRRTTRSPSAPSSSSDSNKKVRGPSPYPASTAANSTKCCASSTRCQLTDSHSSPPPQLDARRRLVNHPLIQDPEVIKQKFPARAYTAARGGPLPPHHPITQRTIVGRRRRSSVVVASATTTTGHVASSWFVARRVMQNHGAAAGAPTIRLRRAIRERQSSSVRNRCCT